MVQHVLTRSVGVICLSQYLQTLIWTVKYMLKNHKHLIPFVIVTRYLNQPHPTLQILRHTRWPTGTTPCSQPGQSTGGLRRVTQTPSTAVPLAKITFAADNCLISSNLGLFGGSPTRDYWHISIFNPDIKSMTIHNNLLTLTLSFPDFYSAQYLDQLFI